MLRKEGTRKAEKVVMSASGARVNDHLTNWARNGFLGVTRPRSTRAFFFLLIQIHKYTHTNTNTQTQIHTHTHKYRNSFPGVDMSLGHGQLAPSFPFSYQLIFIF